MNDGTDGGGWGEGIATPLRHEKSSFLYQSSWNKHDDHTIPYHTPPRAAPCQPDSHVLRLNDGLSWAGNGLVGVKPGPWGVRRERDGVWGWVCEGD